MAMNVFNTYDQPGVGYTSNTISPMEPPAGNSGSFGWGDLLRLAASSSGRQNQPFATPTGLPQQQQNREGHTAPIFNVNSSLPHKKQETDSTSQVLNSLIKYFFGG